MAIGIENYPNIDTTNPAQFPKGQLTDDPTGIAGTPINVLTNGDLHQTFMVLLLQAGLTANGVPDSGLNGYQYLDALDNRWNKPYSSTGIVFGTSPAFANIGGAYYNAAYKIDGNEVSLCGAVTNAVAGAPGAIIILTLPAAARPAKQVAIACSAKTGSTLQTIYLTITTTGVISFGAPSSLSYEIYLDGVRFRKI